MNNSQGPLGTIAQGVVAGIGFVSEVRGYKKARKTAKMKRESEAHEQSQYEQQKRSSSSTSRSLSSGEAPLPTETKADPDAKDPPAYKEIERSWELNEAQDVVIETKKPRKSKGGVANPDKVIAAFLQRRPPPSTPLSLSPHETHPAPKLTYPVAIPQRRPKDKKRGFIRAYALDLQNVGLDQETWFDFIETFNEASLANPWINALNLASLAASPLPSAISTAVSIAIMVATTIAIEIQGRHRYAPDRQNKALDKLNEEFFRPRGLFCLVMAWDSSSFGPRTNIDINTTIQNSIDSQGKMSHKFQSSNGVNNGMVSIKTAQLVFPGLDFLATVSKDEQKGFKKKMERGKLFVDDYMDRRAQAKFFAENPSSHLNQAGKPTFSSKYADPTHQIGEFQAQIRGFASRGDMGRGTGRAGGLGGGPLGLIGLAAQALSDRDQQRTPFSNGNNPPTPYYYRSDFHEESDKHRQYPQHGSIPGNSQQYPQQRGDGGLLNLGKLFNSKVLYLMVVNMPTEKEMAQAKELTSGWNVQSQQCQF
ncbi:hypothetical protein N7532_005826 [Penicillium argentinense]|uniref:Uncharacterized protein n=1 Tax=Penicillium argentinense TaxID=1131581 RepID=A0A9W9FEM4_9EURO|nr:uncharacterized protein N7532_005826 [Penicillium argentinense]KAJ5098825.1 hypothetical protein N7532_005826 [Penicillium argentinense]